MTRRLALSFPRSRPRFGCQTSHLSVSSGSQPILTMAVFLRVVPDLVIEVISPGDRTVEVLAKVLMWLEAGAALVWVADPVAETITVYSNEAHPRALSNDDILDGGN